MRRSYAFDPADKAYKIRELDDALQENCGSAWVLSKYLAIDESMMRCASRYCPILQYLPRKPVKWGIKAFMLVDAKFNYAFK